MANINPIIVPTASLQQMRTWLDNVVIGDEGSDEAARDLARVIINLPEPDDDQDASELKEGLLIHIFTKTGEFRGQFNRFVSSLSTSSPEIFDRPVEDDFNGSEEENEVFS